MYWTNVVFQNPAIMLLKQPLSSKILNWNNIISMLIGQKPFTYTCLSSINMSLTFSMAEFAAFSVSKCTNPYPFLFPSCISTLQDKMFPNLTNVSWRSTLPIFSCRLCKNPTKTMPRNQLADWILYKIGTFLAKEHQSYPNSPKPKWFKT